MPQGPLGATLPAALNQCVTLTTRACLTDFAVLCAVLLGGCMSGGSTAPDRQSFKEDDVQPELRHSKDAAAEWPALHFIEPYSEQKIPVLLVHGINGAPSNFRYLLKHLDRSRFQPWVYAHPDGMHLDKISEHLHSTVKQLRARHHFAQFAVIGHSMGGLIGRDLILRQERSSASQTVPLFVSISTPWDGHWAAQLGVWYAPVVADVWRDLAPGSDYLKQLFATPLPKTTRHHLVFTFSRRTMGFGASNDQKVSVASQLSLSAQREAARIYGFDNTHDGILRDAALAALINELLDKAFPQPR